MSQWTERIRSHAIWAELQALGPALDRAAALPDLSAEVVDGRDWLRLILAFTGRRLAAADQALIDPRILGSLAAPFSNMRQQVESFVASQELSHIAAANASADDVVTVLTNVLYTSAPEELTWIGESSAAYRSAVEGHLKAVKEKHAQIDLAAEQNRVALAGLASDLAAEKQKLASLITEQQSQFTAAQTEHATKFATIVSDIQTSFSASQNDRQAKFTTPQTENQKGFSSDEETRVKEFAVAQGERAQTFVALATQYTQELATHAAELQRLRDGAKTATNDALASLRLQYENGATKILETIQTRKDEV